MNRREFIASSSAATLGFALGCTPDKKHGASELERAVAYFDNHPKKQKAVRFLANETKRRVSQYFPKDTPEPVQDVVKAREVRDSDVITAEQLITNTEYAFFAREYYPWAKELDDDTFTHFVLPYRNGTNALDQFPETDLHWREMFLRKEGWAHLQKKYGIKTSWTENQEKLIDFAFKYRQAKDKRAVLEEVIKYLNTDLWVVKEGLGYKPSKAQEKTLADTLRDKGGRCSNETHFVRMALMAYGIPATTVRIPAWGNASDNHEVLGVWHGNDLILFDALRPELRKDQKEEDYWYTMGNGVPKVYVEKFGDWSQASKRVIGNREEHPWFINFYLGTRSCIDMTKQFTKTIDFKLEGLTANDTTYAYVMNNFCSNGLAAVDVEKVNSDGTVTFNNMGCKGNILYFTANGPVIAHDNQTAEWLKSSDEKRKYEIKGLEKNKLHNLHEWKDGKFVKLTGVMTGDGSIELELKPNTVYAFKNPEEKVWSYSRPFVPRKDGKIEKY